MTALGCRTRPPSDSGQDCPKIQDKTALRFRTRLSSDAGQDCPRMQIKTTLGCGPNPTGSATSHSLPALLSIAAGEAESEGSKPLVSQVDVGSALSEFSV